MKKLLFGLIATVMFTVAGNAQTKQQRDSNKRTLLWCVTTSCCGIGPFSIEVWSETTCTYVSKIKNEKGEEFSHSLKFESKDKVEEVNVPEDVMLAGIYDEMGNNLVLENGNYKVENNQIFFNPKSVVAKTRHCIIRTVQGSFFGHDYGYTIELCITYRTANNGFITITPKLNKEQLAQLLEKGENEIEFKEDISLEKEGVDYTIKAGKYKVNEDGNIYIQNVNFGK